MNEWTDADDSRLLSACTAVNDICVIESSTAYKNPAYEMQSAIQLVQVLLPFIQMGIINPQTAAAKLIQASGERDVQSWFTPPPQSPPQAAPLSAPGNPTPMPEEQAGGAQPVPGPGTPAPPALRMVAGVNPNESVVGS